MKNNYNYRPEIDGLRAIAVLSVVFFHLDIALFSGGYLGVDIFFVISGYLITKLIYDKHAAGNFFFIEFYGRRVRRLMPALFATISITFICASFFFIPVDFVNFAKSSFASTISLSNILFFSETGYWDTEAKLKPLLHTWSLGVEEQFYLIWPALLILIFNLTSRVYLALVVLIIFFTSLISSIFISSSNEEAVFFLLPFRVFEFSIGAFLAISNYETIFNKHLSDKKYLNNFVFLVSLFLILYSISQFTEIESTPGIITLVPCIGAMLLILSGKGSISQKCLANKAMVHIGKISYSMYLTHWPIIAIYRYETGRSLYPSEQVILGVATLVATWALYYLVEKPFRYKKENKTNEKNNFPLSIFLIFLTLLLVSLHAVLSSGWLWRFAESNKFYVHLTKAQVENEREELKNILCAKRYKNLCGIKIEGKRNILVIGDSHASDALNSVYKVFPDYNYLISEHGGCPPLINLTKVKYIEKSCPNINKQLFSLLDAENKSHYSLVIISIRVDDKRVEPLIDTAKYLSSKGFKVLVMGVGPFYSKPIIKHLLKSESDEIAQDTITDIQDNSIFSINETLKYSFVDNPNVSYLDKLNFICFDERCSIFTQDNNLFIFDKHHLTLEGAQSLAIKVREVVYESYEQM